MISKRLEYLLAGAGLNLSGVIMTPQTSHVSVTLTDGSGSHYIGRVEKKPGRGAATLDLAIGEALVRNFPGLLSEWRHSRRVVKRDLHGEILELRS